MILFSCPCSPGLCNTNGTRRHYSFSRRAAPSIAARLGSSSRLRPTPGWSKERTKKGKKGHQRFFRPRSSRQESRVATFHVGPCVPVWNLSLGSFGRCSSWGLHGLRLVTMNLRKRSMVPLLPGEPTWEGRSTKSYDVAKLEHHRLGTGCFPHRFFGPLDPMWASTLPATEVDNPSW